MWVLATLSVLMVLWWAWNDVNRALYRDAFSPFNLLFYFWVAPFVLSLSSLSALQTGFGTEAILVIAGCTVILLVTCLLPAAHRPGPSRTTSPIDGERVLRVNAFGILCFYALTLTALYFAEFSGRDLPLILYLLGGVDDSNLHTAGKDSKLQVIAFGIHAASIFVFYLWLNETRRLRRLLYLTLSLLVVAIGLLKTSKSDVFIPLLSYSGLIYYHYQSRRKHTSSAPQVHASLPRTYKMIAVGALLVVISVTSVRLEGIGLTGGYAGLIEFRYVDELGPVLSEGVAIVYGYTALGFQNFSNYVASHDVVLRLGTSLFRPVLSAMMMGSTADALGVPVDQWNVVSDAANTGTFLTPLYIEGGPAFCLLGALLYGCFVNGVYRAARSRESLGWRFVYISLLFPWTWLFFTNAFSVLSIYVNVFYIGALTWLFVRYKRVARPKPSPMPHSSALSSP